MEMHQVRYFLAVCETLNFTRAAEICHVAQPSLTRAIQKLEDELGGPLFCRERNNTHLTPLGQRMKPHLAQLLSAAESAKAEAESVRKREKIALTLGVMCTIGPSRLVGLIEMLDHRLPALELTLREASGSQIIANLLAGDLDIALLGMPDYPDRLRAEPLYKERYVVAFPPAHRFESLTVVPVSALDGENYLQRLNCEYPDHFRANVGDWPYKINIRYASEREDWIQAMVLAGLGCAVLPEYLPLFPGLKTRVLVEPEVFREISLVTVRGRPFSHAVEACVRLARTYRWGGDASPPEDRLRISA
jgi:DNA-binding transcriptional LysR family regulator